MEKYLYRGVNIARDAQNGGQLKSIDCNKVFKRKQYYSGGANYNDGSVYGESERNAVVQHQKNSSKYPSSGISTTPNYENAVSYARGEKGNSEGYVYTIDASLLEQYGVKTYPVDEHVAKPIKPEDNEIIIVANDFGCIPKQVIVKKEKIT